ncbi:XF1762 family protein [Streptomyces sp. NPDC094466]|uniref:XF1762 family protein n=1 Tax=Streptomyces sp. NPDC094466 TaxID=3366065 RepID=UPI0038174945
MSNGARLHLVPVRSREAREFVRAWHRHHPPPAGQIFAIGAADEIGTLRAVAIVGRPVARHLEGRDVMVTEDGHRALAHRPQTAPPGTVAAPVPTAAASSRASRR